jgi:uncharacterized protein
MRRFMGGAIWGAIVGVLGLGVVSQLAPVPGAVVVDVPVTEPVVAPEPVVDPQPVPETQPIAAPVAPRLDPPATPPVVTADAPLQVAIPETTQTVSPGTSEAATTPVVANTPPEKPLSDTAPVVAQAPAEPPVAPPSDAPAAQMAPDLAGAPAAPLADAPAQLATADSLTPASPGADAVPRDAELPPPPPLTAEEQALLDAAMAGAAPLEPVVNPIVPAPVPVPAAEAAPAPVTEPMALPDTKPVMPPAPAVQPAPDAATLVPDTTLQPTGIIADATPSTLAPTPPLGTEGAVIQRRLPQVDKVADEVAALPEATDENLPPLSRYAAIFENPDGKPLFSIVLIDDGAADLDRTMLAALPFAVSFVVDPLAPNAAEATAIYRAGGKEVLMLATGIPDGATPADLEQTFQAHAAALPEAVAVMDLADAGFQGDRQLATQLVPILAAQGRGLLTWDKGLNAADQVARREALPTAMVFRAVDADGEDAPVIRRYLDRAAFKAAQEGAVTVVGQTRPETVAALLEWAVEGRASTVALAPVSAVLALR